MHPPPQAYHGRANVSTGPKPPQLPMQNKPPLMANNVIQTAIQQGGSLPLMQPKTILKHPSQYKPIISQPQQQHQPQQQQQQQPSQTSQPSTLDGKAALTNNVNNVQSVATTSTLHSIPSQSQSNNLPGSQNPAEKVKSNQTAESKSHRALNSSIELIEEIANVFTETVPKFNAAPSSKQLGKSSTTPTTSPETSIIEVSAASDQIKQISVGENVGQSKDKTPMCLVNELARFNKIQHQYRLTGEQGPAHKKRFTVTLKLGDEEYSSDGASIKKAQHLAAADAITKTQYKHPPAKLNRGKITNGKIDGRGK